MEQITHLYSVVIPETDSSKPNIEFLIDSEGNLTMKATSDRNVWGGKDEGFFRTGNGKSWHGNIAPPKELKSYVDALYNTILKDLKKDLEKIKMSVETIESNMNK